MLTTRDHNRVMTHTVWYSDESDIQVFGIQMFTECCIFIFVNITFFQTLVKTEKGNTSGMAGHLRSLHPDLYRALKSSRDAKESFVAKDDDDDTCDVAALDDIDLKPSVPLPVLSGKNLR